MMKSKLFILFVFLLIWSCKINKIEAEKQASLSHEIADETVYFEISKFQFQAEGELPASQVFFPVFQKTSNVFPSSEGIKKIVRDLVHSRLKYTYNLLYSQASVFSWHSSVIIHVFLKTTCFRI